MTKCAQMSFIVLLVFMNNFEKFHMTEDYNDIYILRYLPSFLHGSLLFKNNLV